MRSRVGAVGLVVAAAAAMACRQIIGLPDNQEGVASASACGLPYGTASCAACVNAGCCSVSTACAGDVACRSLYECLGACAIGDWQCRSQCQLDHPVAASPNYAPLTACAATHCEADCGLTCGGVDDLTPPSAASACQLCLSTMDCKAERACATSVDCVALRQCYRGCVTPDCRAACLTAGLSWLESNASSPYLDAGVPGLLGFGDLLPGIVDPASECTTACAVGANWTCIGNVALRGGTVFATTMSSRVLDYVTQAPVPGVQASICLFNDPTCREPIADASSADSGDLFIPVPPSPAGGLASDGYVQLSSPGIVPALFFWGYPVSLPQAPLAEPYLLVFTPDEVNAVGQSLSGPDASTYSPDEGYAETVAFEVFDCNGVFAPGVTVAANVSPNIAEFYSTSALSLSLTAGSTGTDGLGGLVHVPAGPVTLTATAVSTGKVVSRATVLARDGAQTTVFMFPTE